MAFVLDASMTLAWVFPDEATETTDRLLESLLERQAYAPGLWPIEVANAFLAATRRRRLEASRWPWIRHSLDSLPIAVEPVDPTRVGSAVLELAHDRGISVYDAMYLELALRMGLPLATLDERLAAEARAVGVEALGG
ncbi:MAG: type II toxin-antitoxin system VapC family toxin [Acidobacteria bacterium]|nr:type II toxin-antitoxin system VapC family toxin [Acidobacteriota bacterium]MXZ37565.1 type II toxin-antitoxin system VapC family toxin [Holophagales bacterium]MYJ26925.1 type II toxin-antitoxin system VapC family toxin [Holophagales bacterium]